MYLIKGHWSNNNFFLSFFLIYLFILFLCVSMSTSKFQLRSMDKGMSKVIGQKTTFFNALFKTRVCLLRQPTMSPTNVIPSTDKLKKFWVLPLGWFQTPSMKKCFCLFDHRSTHFHSLLSHFSPLSQLLSLMQATKEVNPHPRIVQCVNIWDVFFFFLCLLNVGACICHIAREGQVEWTTPT